MSVVRGTCEKCGAKCSRQCIICGHWLCTKCFGRPSLGDVCESCFNSDRLDEAM